MYTNLFYFIIVFSVYVLYEPPPETADITPAGCILILAAVVLLVHICSRALFRRHDRICAQASGDRETFAAGHARAINRNIALALIAYGGLLYLGDVKQNLALIPLVDSSRFLQQALGVLPFLAMLAVIWSAAYPSYRREYAQDMSRRDYLLSHARLNVIFVLPWLIFALLQDAVQALPDAVVAPVANSAAAVFAVYAAMLAILACLFPAALVKIWKCRPLARGQRRQHLEEVCRKAGLRYADILEWDLFKGHFITAGVLGIWGKFRYILISPALLSMLDDEELEAVLAHEIGHVHYWHLPFYVFFVIGYGILVYALSNAAYLGLAGRDALLDMCMRADGTFHAALYVMPAALAGLFLLVYFRYLFGWFSRSFERQADAYAVRLMGRPDAIISSLDHIAAPGTAARAAPNWHHYSIQERIAFLSRCGENPELIRRHSGKVACMAAAFAAVIAVAGAASLQFSNASMYQHELTIMQKALERRIEHDRDNPMLLFVLGNVLYEKKLYHQAEEAYMRVIELDSGMHEALNNLAWLYATAEEDSLFKPRKALELASAASAIAPLPHILDTLAEAYFVNGKYREAIAVIQAAISMDPDDADYFKSQLEKFSKYIDREQRHGGKAAHAL